jgi:hypothetical protein
MAEQIVKGSLGAIAAQSGQSLAQTFLSCDVVVIVDTSGSMGTRDASGGQSRYDQACWELAILQGDLPGKIGVISFSDRVMFCANGTPFNFGGGTDLDNALKFAKIADIPNSGMRFIVISDGQPDDPGEALKIARKYHSKIDTIYVGAENGHGRAFLEQLAAASGGSHITAEAAKQLASSVQKLLAA